MKVLHSISFILILVRDALKICFMNSQNILHLIKIQRVAGKFANVFLSCFDSYLLGLL